MPDSKCASSARASQESTASESTASACSDTASGDFKIDANTSAVVAWDGQHTKLDLLVQYDRSSSNAFLKLKAKLALKAIMPAKTYLHLLVPPQRIQTITLDDSPHPAFIPSDTAQILGSAFICLRVTLKTPMDLVGPNIAAHIPRTPSAGRVLDQLRSLARSTEFTLCVPRQLAFKSQLLAMCYGISDRLLMSEPDQIDLTRMYEGQGGAKLAVTRSDQPTIHAPNVSQQQIGDNPPSYADAGPSSSVAVGPAELPPSKRRRLNSEAAVELGSDWLEVMRKMVQDEVRIQVSDEVGKVETRLKDHIETSMNKHYDSEYGRWTEDLEVMQQEFDNKIEDDFFGVRMKLEDYIKEELKETEESIIERLESSTVRLEFAL